MPKVIVLDQCEYIVGAKKAFYHGIRKDGVEYLRPFNAGGIRCENDAVTVSPSIGKRCLEHSGLKNPVQK